MPVIRETGQFSEWMAGLKDGQARIRIMRRLDRWLLVTRET